MKRPLLLPWQTIYLAARGPVFWAGCAPGFSACSSSSSARALPPAPASCWRASTRWPWRWPTIWPPCWRPGRKPWACCGRIPAWTPGARAWPWRCGTAARRATTTWRWTRCPKPERSKPGCAAGRCAWWAGGTCFTPPPPWPGADRLRRDGAGRHRGFLRRLAAHRRGVRRGRGRDRRGVRGRAVRRAAPHEPPAARADRDRPRPCGRGL